ncbi:MAG: hypothetical protein ACFFBD_14450, partial [Candidatus Hodarchaeota archaeon]
NINIWAILRMLSSGPMTINEIHAKHHKVIKDLLIDNTQVNKDSQNQIPKPKSKNTIYKYIQELISIGLVTDAGRRPIPNQSATQKLYSKSAEIFYRIEQRAEYWNSSEAKSVSYVIGLILSYVLKKTEFNHEKLHKVITKFVAELTKSLVNALENAKTTSIVEYMRKYVLVGGQESGTFLYTVGLAEWLINRENVETFRCEILQCFK